ncbi:hypothetical protein IMPR6_700127 [Imperialibacter sp. EC-SDR9]|nr:hypothetical protein IMPERIA89_340533 [Imperialibacter sp. 89]CAD5298807.1 hypothetical protein IMPERIA75_700532 [Imperialibacter sp. 75]VVT35058.1 hypothetical protein IMPR6_700127 [Imperialibacter sp. EC-SDR9]
MGYADESKREDDPAPYSLNPTYPKNEISTPAATAEPITPEILLAMAY